MILQLSVHSSRISDLLSSDRMRLDPEHNQQSHDPDRDYPIHAVTKSRVILLAHAWLAS
jgi:hypothetical protein